MHFFALLAALPAALSTPGKNPRTGDIKDQWIVKLHDGASSDDLQSVIADAAQTFGAEPVHVYVRLASNMSHTCCIYKILTRRIGLR